MRTRTRSAARKNGTRRVKRLNKEAFKIVEENANGIAQALLKSTTEGHVLSARLLVELAEGDVDVEDASMKRPLRSQALQLAEEQQWKGEETDAEAEMEPAVRQPAEK
jgi:hypothetical protein